MIYLVTVDQEIGFKNTNKKKRKLNFYH